MLKKFAYHILALAIVLVWGTTFVSSKVLLISGLSPEEIFFYRFIMAYVLMLGYCLLSGRRTFKTANLQDELKMLAVGVTGGSLYFYTENTALTYTATTNIALILCITPLLTAVLMRLFYKELRGTLTRKFLAGSVTALVGITLVVLNGHFVLHLSPKGDLLCVAASFCWAFYTLLMRDLEKRYDIFLITRRVFFYGVLTILPLYIPLAGSRDAAFFLQPAVWGNLLYLGIVASLLCFLFWNLVLRNINPLHATNYIYFSPVVTAVASFLILHEPVTWIMVLGTILVIGGVWFAQRQSKK